MVFLDWEKAFDKVSHQALKKTLERFNLYKKIVNMVMALYRHLDSSLRLMGLSQELRLSLLGSGKDVHYLHTCLLW